VVLLLPYSLMRWARAREVVLGLIAMALAYLASFAQGSLRDGVEAISAAVVLLFPAAIGTAVRFRAQAERRDREHVKMRERELLARELHDTVAHHASAIVIQARAARTVLERRPEAALAALHAIEGEASKALAELRSLVGTLRDNAAADFAPQAGLRDLEQLVERAGPHVRLEKNGELEELPVALQAGLYRIAQESLTNALRHASDATRIQLRVNASASEVTLSVEDDGKPLASTHTPGFGLLGMRERATLLGGTLHAGRKSEGGFKVEAVLPRKAEAR
jgi:signal transduction histidine kinase